MVKKKYELLTKHELTIKDIAILMDCGISKAAKYRNRFIKEKNIKSDYFGITILTSEFIDFYKIDVEMISDKYILEQQLNNGGGINATST